MRVSCSWPEAAAKLALPHVGAAAALVTYAELGVEEIVVQLPLVGEAEVLGLLGLLDGYSGYPTGTSDTV